MKNAYSTTPAVQQALSELTTFLDAVGVLAEGGMVTLKALAGRLDLAARLGLITPCEDGWRLRGAEEALVKEPTREAVVLEVVGKAVGFEKEEVKEPTEQPVVAVGVVGTTRKKIQNQPHQPKKFSVVRDCEDLEQPDFARIRADLLARLEKPLEDRDLPTEDDPWELEPELYDPLPTVQALPRKHLPAKRVKLPVRKARIDPSPTRVNEHDVTEALSTLGVTRDTMTDFFADLAALGVRQAELAYAVFEFKRQVGGGGVIDFPLAWILAVIKRQRKAAA